MFEKLKDIQAYEKEIRKIKKEHFTRVKDLEDRVHELELQLKGIESKHKIEIQGLESDYEQQILNLTHQLQLEKERFELQKQTRLIEADREIHAKKEEFLGEKYDGMQDLADRERSTFKDMLRFTLERLPQAKIQEHNIDAKGEIKGLPEFLKKDE